MGSRSHQPERGSARLRAVIGLVIGLVIVTLVLYGVYKLVPWTWRGVQALLIGITVWWQVEVTPRVLNALIQVLVETGGQVIVTLGVAALAHCVLVWVVGGVSKAGFRRMADHQRIMQENIIGQMENVQGKLKRLFADDIEKIALFAGKISGGQFETVSSSRLASGCFGCLPSLLWMAFSSPIMIMIGIALYDGMLRLFGASEPSDLLLVAAGSKAEELSALLPLEKSVSLAGMLTVNLSERSLALTAILGAVGLIGWFVTSISNSGWTVPRLINISPLVAYLFFMALSYFFLNSAILIFAIFCMSYSVIYTSLGKFLIRPLYLRVRAFITSRARPS